MPIIQAIAIAAAVGTALLVGLTFLTGYFVEGQPSSKLALAEKAVDALPQDRLRELLVTLLRQTDSRGVVTLVEGLNIANSKDGNTSATGANGASDEAGESKSASRSAAV